MVKLLAVTIITATLLTGCSLLPNLPNISDIVRRGAKVNDTAVDTAKFTLCHGASIGSLRRQFTMQEREELWKTLDCPEYKEPNPTQPNIGTTNE
jgi:hypothetical protein